MWQTIEALETYRPWKMIPLGKKIYEFAFTSLEDHVSVVGTWNLQGVTCASPNDLQISPP